MNYIILLFISIIAIKGNSMWVDPRFSMGPPNRMTVQQMPSYIQCQQYFQEINYPPQDNTQEIEWLKQELANKEQQLLKTTHELEKAKKDIRRLTRRHNTEKRDWQNELSALRDIVDPTLSNKNNVEENKENIPNGSTRKRSSRKRNTRLSFRKVFFNDSYVDTPAFKEERLSEEEEKIRKIKKNAAILPEYLGNNENYRANDPGELINNPELIASFEEILHSLFPEELEELKESKKQNRRDAINRLNEQNRDEGFGIIDEFNHCYKGEERDFFDLLESKGKLPKDIIQALNEAECDTIDVASHYKKIIIARVKELKKHHNEILDENERLNNQAAKKRRRRSMWREYLIRENKALKEELGNRRKAKRPRIAN